MGSADMIVAVETNVVFALQALGRHDEALVRARDLVARLADSDGSNALYAWLGFTVSLQALHHTAEFRAALPRAARVMRLHGLPLLAPQCALVLFAESRTVEALRVLGHARARFAAKGMTMTSVETARLTASEQQARAVLGDAAVDLCLAEGATLDEAMVEALMQGDPEPAQARTAAVPTPDARA
jgi:hypothetical protein